MVFSIIEMQEQTYLLLSLFSIAGVILSYCIPIVGGIIEDIIVLISNGLIVSIVIKHKLGQKKIVKILEEKVELTAFK